jgi:hypothetical protein
MRGGWFCWDALAQSPGAHAANDLKPGHKPQRHPEGDDRRLDEVLDGGRCPQPQRHLLQLRQEQRTHGCRGDSAAAAEQRCAAEDDGRDRRQQIGAADEEARNAKVTREQNAGGRVDRAGRRIGRDLIAGHPHARSPGGATIGADRDETAPDAAFAQTNSNRTTATKAVRAR